MPAYLKEAPRSEDSLARAPWFIILALPPVRQSRTPRSRSPRKISMVGPGVVFRASRNSAGGSRPEMHTTALNDFGAVAAPTGWWAQGARARGLAFAALGIERDEFAKTVEVGHLERGALPVRASARAKRVDAGMSVTCVTSADEARAWLGRSDVGQSVDLVLLNWRLDGSRTRDLLALARSTVGVAPNRVVVVVASHADAEPAHASLRALGFGLLRIKPASPSAVFSTMRT